MLDPLGYPWRWSDGPVRIGCTPDHSSPDTARTLLVATGANGAPAVLHDKLHAAGVACDALLVPVTVIGIGVGHSAHVSRRGYLPAAPFAAPGVSAVVRAAWFDDAQLAALDDTEPSYRRVVLSGYPITGVPGAPATFHVYVSRYGVLARGAFLPFLPQPALHAVLSDWLESTAVFDPVDPRATAARLALPAVQQEVRDALAVAGLVWPAGLGPLG